MKTNIILSIGILTIALVFSGCGAPPAANAAKPAASNSANKTSDSTTNTAANTASAPKADGDVLKIDEAGIQMVVPKGFKFSKDGQDTVVKSEDEGVDIRFSVPKDGDYDKIVEDAANEIDDYLVDVKVNGEVQTRSLNGMETRELNGTALTEEKIPVMWNLTVLKTPKRPVLINVYAEKDSIEKSSADVKKFLQSIQKVS